MKEFFVENWMFVLIAVVYVAERAQYLSAEWAARIRSLVEVLTHAAVPGVTMEKAQVKNAMMDRGLYHDIEIDRALDVVQPKLTPRVSKAKKILSGALKVLPFVTRFLK